MKKDVILYKITRPLITIFVKIVFRPKIIGADNIPKDGRVILAGNHKSIMDAVLLISTTKRNIHFLAKKELWDGILGLFYSNMGLIPVDRSNKDHNALVSAEEYLNNDLLVGIFPEGTTEKGGKLLPFKMGVIKMADETRSPIVPFAITGEYKIFNNKLKVEFLPPIEIQDSYEKELDNLRNIIKKTKGE